LTKRRTALASITAILLLLLLLAGFAWITLRFTGDNPGGLSFLTYWQGVRALLVEGESPYSSQVQDQIRIITEAWPVGAVPDLRPTYPLYAAAFFLPFASLSDYDLARALWVVFLVAALILLAALNLRLAKWGRNWHLLGLYFLFALAWLHSLLPLLDGSAIILVALLLTAFFLALRAGNDELAGLALAFSTIIPSAVVLLVAYVALWSLIQQRWALLVWLLGSLGLLTAGGMLFIADWPLGWVRTLFSTPDPLLSYSTGGLFAQWWPGAGQRLSWLLAGVVVLVLLLEWGLSFRREGFTSFYWTACLTLAVAPLSGLPASPVHYILLFIPLAFVWAVWLERMESTGLWVTLLSMVLLLALPWAWYLNRGGPGLGPEQLGSLLLPLPVFLLAGLYWTRWWALRPGRLYAQLLRDHEVF
jgi:hypothetical protein